MTHIPDSCYHLTHYCYTFSGKNVCVCTTIIMTDIAQLQLLIQQEEERGDDLEQKITPEMRLLEEAEHQKLIIMRQILEQRLDELKKENMMKKQKILDIQKWKGSTLGEVHELGGAICSKGKLFSFTSYLLMYFLTFTGVFISSYVIFIYVYFLILHNLFFYVFDRKR